MPVWSSGCSGGCSCAWKLLPLSRGARQERSHTSASMRLARNCENAFRAPVTIGESDGVRVLRSGARAQISRSGSRPHTRMCRSGAVRLSDTAACGARVMARPDRHVGGTPPRRRTPAAWHATVLRQALRSHHFLLALRPHETGSWNHRLVAGRCSLPTSLRGCLRSPERNYEKRLEMEMASDVGPMSPAPCHSTTSRISGQVRRLVSAPTAS